MRKLVIKNFGPVHDAELELKDVNLFIGEQSVGKSTLAKLVTIFTDYSSLAMIISSGFQGWKRQLVTFNLLVEQGENYLIQYDLEEGSVRFHIVIRAGKVTSYIISSSGGRITNKTTIQEKLFSLKPIYHREEYIEQIKLVKEKISSLKDTATTHITIALQQILYNSLYIPAERIVYSLFQKLLPALNLMKDSVAETFLRFMIEITNAKTKYSYYDSDILNIKYIQDNSEDYFVDFVSKKKLPFTNASSGIQSTLPLLLVLEYAVNYREYSSFVIEEPETNLYPSKQIDLLRFILRKVKSDNRTVTITTHSPYLLSAMNNSLFAGQLLKDFGEEVQDKISTIPILKSDECSVYSLGESINGKGVYCRSLIDIDTGMVDVNALDRVSFDISDEFDRLSNLYIELSRKQQ